jgi:hypothetical protein
VHYQYFTTQSGPITGLLLNSATPAFGRLCGTRAIDTPFNEKHQSACWVVWDWEAKLHRTITWETLALTPNQPWRSDL